MCRINYNRGFPLLTFSAMIGISYSSIQNKQGQFNEFSLNNKEELALRPQVTNFDEFAIFEEKLRKLNQMLSEETQRTKQLNQEVTQQTVSTSTTTTTEIPKLDDLIGPYIIPPLTTPSPPKEPQNWNTSSQSGGQQKKYWFQMNSPEEQTADDMNAVMNELANFVAPIDIISGVMNSTLMRPIKSMGATAQTVIGPYIGLNQMKEQMPKRLTEDLTQLLVKLMRLVIHQMPRIAMTMPSTIRLLSRTLDKIRVQSSQMVRSGDTDVVSKLQQTLYAWAMLLAQTALMSLINAELLVRAAIKIFRATPLPVEILRLETALASVIHLLSTSLPIAIRLVSGQLVNGDVTALNTNLNRLAKCIEDINRAMVSLQEEVAIFTDMVESTVTVMPWKYAINNNTLGELNKGLTQLTQILMTLPDNLRAILGVIFNIKDVLPRVSNIMKGLKDPVLESLVKLIPQTLMISEMLKHLDSELVSKLSANLLTSFMALFEALFSGLNSSNPLMSATRPMISVIEACIDTIIELRNANIVVPVSLTQLMMDILNVIRRLAF